MAHTIVLLQHGCPVKRTYTDYETVDEAMEGICRVYEKHLKRANPFRAKDKPSVTYDISQLFDFIDKLSDLSCLVYEPNLKKYSPYPKEWIKEKIFVMLRRAANKTLEHPTVH